MLTLCSNPPTYERIYIYIWLYLSGISQGKLLNGSRYTNYFHPQNICLKKPITPFSTLFLASFHKVCNWKAYYINRTDPCGNRGLLNNVSTFKITSEVVVSNPLTKHYYRQIGASSNSGDQHQTWLIRNDQGSSTAFSYKQKNPKPPPSTFSSQTPWNTTMQVRGWESASKRKLLSWYAMAKWSPQKRRPGPADGSSRYHQIINLSPISHQPLLWSIQKPVAASMGWALCLRSFTP